MKKKLLVLFAFAMFHNVPANAGMQEADVAYDKGDYSAAIREWLPLAKKGNAKAQTNLGMMYETGRGVPKDYIQAILWYRKAAEQGSAPAQAGLGYLYQEDGIDDTQAVYWLRKAADQGMAEAQYNLGTMYYSGRGVHKDDTQAVAWFRKSAEQDFTKAQYNLGVMYNQGKGVSKDDSQAVVWLRKAAAKGNADAKNILLELETVPRTSVAPNNRACENHRCTEQIAVTATVSDPSLPGAIICRDYDTVSLMIRLYRNFMEENLRASIMGAERERMLHGAPTIPNISRFGCTLLPSGTPMMWEGSWVPPVVTIKLNNGELLRGVTDPSMIKR